MGRADWCQIVESTATQWSNQVGRECNKVNESELNRGQEPMEQLDHNFQEVRIRNSHEDKWDAG